MRLASRISQLSRSSMGPLSNSATAAGTKVRDKIIARVGRDDGKGHRVEHFALDTAQRKYRHVHHHDDELTEDQRTARLLRRGETSA